MKKQKKQLKYKDCFNKFPPILREMVMQGLGVDKNKVWDGGVRPSLTAFSWIANQCFNDEEFWDAVDEDAIHHKIWG